MDTETLKSIFNNRKELLSLPQTLAEVIRLTRDERSSVDDLAKVLMRDPPLTAKVLRVVNSPFYGAGRQIGSMTQAVMTLGSRQITALALSTSIYNVTNAWDCSFDRFRFWRHSLEVAIGARMIAEKTGNRQADEAFVAGLLHDIGLLILEDAFPDAFERIWKVAVSGGNHLDLEEEAWGTNHARVGQFLLEQWHLPESICQAAGRHHNIFVPGSREPELILCQVICLANHISRFSLVDHTAEEVMVGEEQRETLQVNLQLSRDQFRAVEKDLFSQTIAEAGYLEMDIGSIDDILMEANRMLFDQYVVVENLLRDNRQLQQQILRDQVKRASLESLRSTTTTFARYADDAVESIMRKAEEVKAGINSGAIHDPTGFVQDSVNAILNGSSTVRCIIDELQSLATLETGVSLDETYRAAVEEKIKRQLRSIETAASPQ